MSKTSHGGKRNRWRKLAPAEKAAIKIDAAKQRIDELASQPLLRVELSWDPKKAAHPPGFYTYQLIDPRTETVFYVGKGQRFRAWQHEREVRAGRFDGNARKVTRIREILRAELEVRVEIVGIYRYEADALEHEFRLIDADPTLTNIAPGWLSAEGSAVALEQRRLRREVRLAEARERDRQASAKWDREQKRNKFLSVPNAGRHADEINAWVDSLRERGGSVQA